MDNQPDDPVLTQLRKLREGAGLTADRLERSGAVMSALGTSDPHTGIQRLTEALTKLGDNDRARALQVDLGVNFAELVGREAATREQERLGERRSAYAEIIQRDVKTLSRWSDRAVAELRGHLLADTFTGHLYVVAAVAGNRILSTSLIQEPLNATKDGITERSSMDITNPSSEPSMPFLVYGYPRDWLPATVTLAVAFRSEPYPTHVWGTYVDNFLKLPYGEQRYPLTMKDGATSCTFRQPRTDLLYGVWWVMGG